MPKTVPRLVVRDVADGGTNTGVAFATGAGADGTALEVDFFIAGVAFATGTDGTALEVDFFIAGTAFAVVDFATD